MHVWICILMNQVDLTRTWRVRAAKWLLVAAFAAEITRLCTHLQLPIGRLAER
jgi:hypothetical protein